MSNLDLTKKLIKLDTTIIPVMPIIWYREKCLVCPIDYIGILKMASLRKIFTINKFIYIFILL